MAYTTLVASADYKTKIDNYNYFAAGKAWTTAWTTANPDLTIDDTVTKKYTDILRTATVDGTEIKIAPEMPMTPILPLEYPGPKLHYGAAAQPISTFMMTGGMGMPTLGKIGFKSIGGYGHAFGVRGQGNEDVSAVASDTAKNYIYPAQETDLTACKSSYLYVIVAGTAEQ
jgi:hypothetical protein